MVNNDNMSGGHYYILPDGSTAANMKEGANKLGKSGTVFAALVKKGIIKKVITSNTNSNDNNNKH